MKYILLALALIFSLRAEAATFIEGLEDVPVMEGLRQEKNDAISFGNEESRFVEAILTSKRVKFLAVEKFYKDTLPQMGWKCVKENEEMIVFSREEESLEMVREQASPLRIRITVKSKN